MKRLLTMFSIAALFAAVLVFAGCESARAAPAVEIATTISQSDSVLQLNKEMTDLQQVTAFEAVDSGLLLSSVTPRNEKATTIKHRITVTQWINAKPPDPSSYFAKVQARPKIHGFNGIGYNHFARADV